MSEAEIPSGQSDTFNDVAQEIGLVEKLQSCTPGMVAHHLKEAADFLEQYIQYLGLEEKRVVERDDATSVSYSKSKTKPQPFHYVVTKARYLIGKCFVPKDKDDGNPSVEVSTDQFGSNIRMSIGNAFIGIQTLIGVAKLAKEHFSRVSLTLDKQSEFPLLTLKKAESILNQLCLTHMYAGFCAALKNQQTELLPFRALSSVDKDYKATAFSLFSKIGHKFHKDIFDETVLKEMIVIGRQEKGYAMSDHLGGNIGASFVTFGYNPRHWWAGVGAAQEMFKQKTAPQSQPVAETTLSSLDHD